MLLLFEASWSLSSVLDVLDNGAARRSWWVRQPARHNNENCATIPFGITFRCFCFVRVGCQNTSGQARSDFGSVSLFIREQACASLARLDMGESHCSVDQNQSLHLRIWFTALSLSLTYFPCGVFRKRLDATNSFCRRPNPSIFHIASFQNL